MFVVTYTSKSGRKMSRDHLSLAEARADARRIARRLGRTNSVKVWTEAGHLVATV